MTNDVPVARRVIILCLTALTALALVQACGDSEPEYSGEPSGLIFFSTNGPGNAEIYTMLPDGSDPANITNSPADETAPNIDASGTRLAFASTESGRTSLWTAQPDGSGAAPLPNGPTSGSGQPAWSPDGAYLAFFSNQDVSRGFLWLIEVGRGEPFPLLDAISPSGLEVVCAGGTPGSWTPDGMTVIYEGMQGDIRASQICRAGTDGSGIEAIYSDEEASTTDPRLSPDGRLIAFSANAGNADINVMKSDGSDVQRLTVDPGADVRPAWSPDGQWIAFASDRDGDFEIYIMRPDGTDVRRLTDNTADDIDPSWGTPD